MGILYNTGSAIVVDAVLTDLGRKLLARNDGSFRIVAYAFGDDGIDYSLYDPSAGDESQREALIMSTPMLEASTNEDVALKHRLITIRDPTLTTLPQLSTLSTAASGGTIREVNADSQPIKFAQTMPAGMLVPAEIKDDVFIIEVDNYLLNVYRASTNELLVPASVTPLNVAQYYLTADDVPSASGGGQIGILVNVKPLPRSLWSTLAAGSGPVGSRKITTQIRCTGVQSGISAVYTLTISEVS